LRLVLASALLALVAQAERPQRPIIRQLDHLQIESPDPRELFDFFTDTLQLPVAWTYSETDTSAGGGFGTANFSVQIFRPAQELSAGPSGTRARARYVSIALEPYSLSECLPQLQARSIAHNKPAPYVSTLPDQSQGTLWTTVLLTGLSKPALGLFIYEYSRAFLNVHVRRNQLAGEITLRKGGPLGIVSVKEIAIATTSPRSDAYSWQSLLAPLKPLSPGVWKPGNGPAIRLVQARDDRIESVLLGVRSLEQALKFLQEQKMLGAARREEIRISPAQTQGLILRLAEE